MIIKTKKLKKVFRVKQKKQGFIKGLQSLYRPNYKTVEAVSEIDFKADSGEMIAFIGPNGAGKSTTLKMLTGILTPTSGDIEVMGYNPNRERSKLAYNIGTVYGQKSQLWFHLPPIDTFHLFAKIYEIDDCLFKKQLSLLTEMLELDNYLYTPARRLSLGQRMKCEIAASLLHRPKLLFLDEPTIGLDLVAKQQIRQGLREMNRLEGTTVILTSHDVGDIESVCDRVVIINEGSIIFDDRIKLLKQKFLTHKILEVQFDQKKETITLPPDVEVISSDNNIMELRLPNNVTEVSKLINILITTNNVVDVGIKETSMEKIIHNIYTKKISNFGVEENYG
ncbi:MAG: ATP-binding cassette domain-containing protein [Halanaerobiales bacterium]|nr:ATP-binding cassette domain-containing protein [Halanaerobiales bacterium]